MSVETFLNGRVTLFCGDSRDVLKGIPDCSVDSVVCDPPYALVSIVKRFGGEGAAECAVYEAGSGVYARSSAGFMGQKWDTGETAFSVDFWRQVLRVLKPGGHIVAFGGTRTSHQVAMAIEVAGFEIRDSIALLYDAVPEVRAFIDSLTDTQASAFARVFDLIGFGGVLAWIFGQGFPKSTDFAAVPGSKNRGGRAVREDLVGSDFEDGWGTALKPALEPICLARKPLSEDSIAANVLRWGTGAINIDGCRIETNGEDRAARYNGRPAGAGGSLVHQGSIDRAWDAPEGRWPANVIHDGSDEVMSGFPESTSGSVMAGTIAGADTARTVYGAHAGYQMREIEGSSGSAARFFYAAKADADDRLGSKHPTVKPVDLMQWLCRLVTPKGGTVLDPFAGTGTTGEAAFREGFNAILIEREAEYQADIRRRMALVMSGPEERCRESIKARIGHQPFEAGSLFASLQSEAAAET